MQARFPSTFFARRGPDTPEDDQDLILDWFNGTTYKTVWALNGGKLDSAYLPYEIVITDPAALDPNVHLRLRATSGTPTRDNYEGLGPQFDDFFVDAFTVRCGPIDNDGDSIVANLDCDDSDPLHYFDCGQCVDPDGDGRGEGCDLGHDCDESDASVHRGANDPPGDGVDQDCSGHDGPGFFDDASRDTADEWLIESGILFRPASPTFRGRAGIGVANTPTLTTPFVATTSCTSVFWSLDAYGGSRYSGVPPRG